MTKKEIRRIEGKAWLSIPYTEENYAYAVKFMKFLRKNTKNDLYCVGSDGTDIQIFEKYHEVFAEPVEDEFEEVIIDSPTQTPFPL